MFKVSEGSIATDRDEVQEFFDNHIFADYFSSAERNDLQQKDFFRTNDFVTTLEMNIFCSTKGE